jgi:hypothetical protein
MGVLDYDRMTYHNVHDERDRRFRGTRNTRFRMVPNDTTLRPRLIAFAKALSNMVALREAVLWCHLAWGPFEDYYHQAVVEEWLAKHTDNMEALARGMYYVASWPKNYMYTESRI